MNKMRLKFILFWFFASVSFIILAGVLILEAYGYRFNHESGRLEETGVILLDSQPRQVEVTVNGKVNTDSYTPVRLAKILPGQYDITIERPDYQTWSKTFYLKAGQAIDESRIQLYHTNPLVQEYTKKITLKDLQNDFRSQANGLTLKDNEVWYNEKLVTRFSQKPQGAILTPDRYHIIYQLDREIGVIEIDGTNNCKLVTLGSSEAVAFALYSDKLVYAQNGKFYEADIK